MPVRLALVALVLVAILLAYLASLNTAPVRLTPWPGWSSDVPVGALVVGPFLLGLALALLLRLVRDLGRAYGEAGDRRRARRAASMEALYRRGVEAELAGRLAAAGEAYEALVRQEPGYAEAHARLAELARARGDEPGALLHALDALRYDDRPATLLAAGAAYRRAGRPDDAMALYRDVLARDPEHLAALRALRDLAAEQGRWADALPIQERLGTLVRDAGRAREGPGARALEAGGREELAWLAGIHYELGRARLAEGDAPSAIAALREALRAQPDFVPALLALGDAHVKAGDAAQALRVWERGVEARPALPLLSRIEHLHRAEGRPTRMIALYQEAVARFPDNLALGLSLGRVYYELSMLDEAADEFEKLEVRAPDLPGIHAYLGVIFERRGEVRDALEEYRRALALTSSFDWPHRCVACGAGHARWVDRCPACRRWNTSQP